MFLLVAIATGCNDKDTDSPRDKNLHFVSATPLQGSSLFVLKAFAAGLGKDELIPMLNYNVETYRFVYKTSYKGERINASGLIFLPQNMKEEAPIISVQHGTTFVKTDAPSVALDFTGTEFFAAAGYITLMPDFIGYGESADIFHPYYDKEHSALAVTDMIKAVKEYLNDRTIAFNDKLFLAGYSEGGYVTLAAAHALENTPGDNVPVTAVAAGAGGYDLVEMLHGVTTTNYYAYPSYLAFVMLSYNTTYHWNKPIDYFFNQPYADSLAKYMDGKYDGSFINSKLTTETNKLFNTQFFERLLTVEGEQDVKQAMIDNSVSGWSTQTPIRLYHGSNDEIIPYHNSEVTLQNFINLGSSHVTLTPIQGGKHGNSFIPMLEDVIPWFETLKK